MGGHKKAHRTKGNARPSSSGRSAEILSVSRNNLKGPLCFSELSVDLPSYVPPVGLQPEDTDSAVDGNFRMVMRKMTKRDATTKLKAMQEFSELCKNKDEEIVKGILQFWPRLYNKMAVECDRRVREATHQAHEQLVLKVGRSLAPHLRTIMGVWLASQCDPYAPAASAAKVSFHGAFPTHKQSEACMFCKEDMFNYFTDILFQQTPETLSDEKTTPKEEMENKYVRMISCCLLGMEVFIRTVRAEDRNSIEETVAKVLTEIKFWKYAKHKDPLVRRSWYTAIICLYQCIPNVLGSFSTKLCPATLGCLAESDPAVAPAVWEAALYTVVTFENCWQSVNVRKIVLPQLQALLQEGGRGNAVVLFPNLLPLLSKIPQDVKKETDFYEEFFSNLKHGLSLEKVKKSSSEFNAIVKAYLECFGYVIICNVDVTNHDFSVLENLVLNQLLPLVQSSFQQSDSYLAQSYFYPALGEMLRSLELKKDRQHLQILDKVLSLFWDKFITICHSVLENVSETQIKSLHHLAQFFHSLHCYKGEQKYKSKKRFTNNQEGNISSVKKTHSKVTFEDMVEKKSCKDDDFSSVSLFAKACQFEVFSTDSHLVSNTHKLCKIVFDILQSTLEYPYLKLFTEVIGTIPSEELFSRVLNGYEGWNGNKQEAPLLFFNKVISHWLAADSINIECIADLIFSICSCLNEKTSTEVLNKLCNVNNSVLLHCVLQKALEFCPQDPILRNWLKSDEMGQTMVAIAIMLSQLVTTDSCLTLDTVDAMWNCLSVCFRTSEPLIKPAYLEQILGIFHTYLKKPGVTRESGNKNAMKLAEFACELASTLYSSYQDSLQLSSAEDLLVTLFCLSCQSSEYPLPEHLDKKIIEALQKEAKHLVNVKSSFLNDNGFLYKATKKIHELTNGFTSLESVDKLIKSTWHLFMTVNGTEGFESNIHPVIFDLLDIVLPSENEWIDESCKLSKKTTLPALTDDGFTLFLPPEEQQLPVQQDKLVTCHTLKAYYTSELLIEMIDSQKKKYLSDEETNAFLKHLPHIMFAEVWCTKVGFDKIAISKVSDSPDNLLFRKLSENSSILLNILTETKAISFLQRLHNLSLKEGNWWALVLHHGIATLKKKDIPVNSHCIDSVQNMTVGSSISQLHTLQALILHLPPEQVAKLAISSINFLVCSEELFLLDGVLGHLVIICSCIHIEDVAKLPVIHEEIAAVLEFLIGLKKTKVDFLCDCDITSTDKNLVCFVSQISLFLSSVIKFIPQILTSEQWDFILCTLVGWLQTSSRSKDSITQNVWSLHLIEHSCWLLRYLSLLLGESKPANNSCTFSTELHTEWEEFYSNIIFTVLLPLFVELSEKCTSSALLEVRLLQNMALALETIPTDHILRCSFFPEKVHNVQETEYTLQLPEYVHSLLNHLAPLLTCEIWSVQFGAHCLLMKVMGRLPEIVIQVMDDKKVDREENSCAPPAALEHILRETTSIVETMLCDIRVGDSCIVKPHTDSYTYATAYLLSWMELLEFFSASSSENRSAYACYLRDSGLLQSLLSNLFRLMPANPTLRSTSRENKLSSPCKGTNTRTMFKETPELLFDVTPGLEQLQHLACQVYLCALKKVPALVRQWWNNQDKRTADIVNRFTSKYVSNCICAQEIQAVHDADKKFSNMIVKARPTAREVVATYIIDEMSIELSIQLPSNHPLGPVSVESQRRVGVSQTQWRNWMLQLTTFLTHQNGSILDGLALWKHSVDKRFEGVEECMICFYVLHGSTYQLPRLTCRTCKKKFHSPCLYKWFSMSNNSTCPLCRNLF